MKKFYLFLAFVFLFSCSNENEVNPNTSNIYKVVIEQSGDYANYNKSLVALTPDLNGQLLKFNSIENKQTTDGYIENSDLAEAKTTLVSQQPSNEIEFDFIINPIPVAPDMAGPMVIKFTFYKDEKSIGEKSFSYISDFVVKQEKLKFK